MQHKHLLQRMSVDEIGFASLMVLTAESPQQLLKHSAYTYMYALDRTPFFPRIYPQVCNYSSPPALRFEAISASLSPFIQQPIPLYIRFPYFFVSTQNTN